MIPIKDGHIYRLSDNTVLVFKHGENGHTTGQLTSCELLDVLIHRMEKLNELNRCHENSEALKGLDHTIYWLTKRAARIAKEKEAAK